MGDDELVRLLAERGIRSQRVLGAMGSLERAAFLPPGMRDEAARDTPLPIGHGQTISQPYIVAYMTEVLDPQPGERILEIGTGSGYQAAVLARMGAEVYSVEIVPALARQAAELLPRLGLPPLHLRQDDGRQGWPEEAPFDAILLTAAPESLPEPLLWQLKPGGRLLAPVGAPSGDQHLVLVRKGQDGTSQVERLLAVRFVPLTHQSDHAS